VHRFLELLTVAFTLVAGVHAAVVRRAEGLWLFGSLLLLGFVRENLVAIERLLYRFAPLELSAGAAPLLAAVIWAYSIYAAVVWAEAMAERRPAAPPFRLDGAATLARVALFMVALAAFYEPFLGLSGMARWEAGTCQTGGVPWIALVGYPSLAVAFLWIFAAAARRFPLPAARLAALALTVPLLAAAHASGLAALKRALGW
jgi:hypothetical protein